MMTMKTTMRFICGCLVALVFFTLDGCIIASPNCLGSKYKFSDFLTLEYRLISCINMVSSPNIYPSKYNVLTMIDIDLGNISLIRYDDETNTAFVQMEMKLGWEDLNLQWSLDRYPLKEVIVPSWFIWTPKPEMFLNYFYGKGYRSHNYKVKIRHDGWVSWYLHLDTYLPCRGKDTRWFPYDSRVCQLSISFEQFNQDRVKMRVVNYGRLLSKNREWIAESEPMNLMEDKDLNFDYIFVQMQRVPTYYNYIIVAPSIIIVIFLLLVLWVPMQTNQRFNLVTILIMSILALYGTVQQLLPVGNVEVPVILRLLLFELMLVLVTYVVAILTYNLYYNNFTTQVPHFLKLILFNPFLRALTTYTLPGVDIKFNSPTSTLPSAEPSRDPDESPQGALKSSDPFVKTMASFNKFLTSNLDSSEVQLSHAEVVRNEWKQVAYVLERLFSIGLSFVVLIGVLVIIPRSYTKMNKWNIF